MSGTITKSHDNSGLPGGTKRDLLIQFNKVITDLETLRAGTRYPVRYQVEDLSAGADIAAWAVFKAPVAMTVLDTCKVVHCAASSGVDGSNTAVLTIRNITEGVDVASATLTANASANTASDLTLTGANADIAANDVLGIVVTQGAAADLAAIIFQWEMRPQTVDAAADLTAAQVGNESGTAITA